MVEPLFYILGIALVLVALAISFTGMRSERFPGSGRLMAAIAGGTALLVVGVAVFGVLLAREEQQHRLEERAKAEEEAVEEEEPAVEEPAAPAEEPPPEGRELFVQTCSACHVLADAETTGTIGPNLDTEVPQAQDEQFVRETILDPPPGMAIPELPDDQVDAIAAYVASVAGQ